MKRIKKSAGTTTAQHLSELQKTRQIIVKLITFIDEASSIQPTSDDIESSSSFPPQWKLFCGEKENLVSALVKLTGLLTKVIPMEQELSEKTKKTDTTKQPKILSKEDKAIIQKYLQKYSDKKTD